MRCLAGAAIMMTLLAGCSAILDFGDSTLIDGGPAGDGGGDGGGGDGGGEGGRPDAAIDAAVQQGPDATVGVECMGMSCPLPGQECCIAAAPATPVCIDVTGTCQGQIQRCDGPEDCSGGEVCCAQVPNSFILCRPYGSTTSDCDGTLTGVNGKLVLCHHDRDCPGDKPVCQDCASPSLRFCRATLATGCTPAN